MAARAADVRDVGGRVVAHLEGRHDQGPTLTEPSIIVAHDLTPSETARLPKELLLGIVTEVGGRRRTWPSWPGHSASPSS